MKVTSHVQGQQFFTAVVGAATLVCCFFAFSGPMKANIYTQLQSPNFTLRTPSSLHASVPQATRRGPARMYVALPLSRTQRSPPQRVLPSSEGSKFLSSLLDSAPLLAATCVAAILYGLNRLNVYKLNPACYGSDAFCMTAISGDAQHSDHNSMTRSPLQIFGEDESTFCYLTLKKRMPAIARDVIADNAFLTEEQKAAVEAIAVELESDGRGVCRKVERLKADSTLPYKASDYERSLFEPFEMYIGKQWRETPWLHGEIYFYHRLLEATGWFEHRKDIFKVPKMKSLDLSTNAISALTSAVVDDGHLSADAQPAMLDKLLHSCLWGNKVDLCLFTVSDFSDSGVQSAGKDDNVLSDESSKVVEYMQSLKGKGQVDFILDNFGYELFTDLVLTYFLLEYNWTEKIVLHCKQQPYYVSDALEPDVDFMIDHLQKLGVESASTIGRSLRAFHDNGRLTWTSHPYWMAPSEFHEMPADVRESLAPSKLAIIKGDLNYRRLVGDRHWPHTTPFETTVSYFPTNLVAIRTLKSELLVGATEEALKYAKEKEPDRWLVGGMFGVVQYWAPSK